LAFAVENIILIHTVGECSSKSTTVNRVYSITKKRDAIDCDFASRLGQGMSVEKKPWNGAFKARLRVRVEDT